jgi:hypothetical protein
MKVSLNSDQLSFIWGDVVEFISTKNILSLKQTGQDEINIHYAQINGHEWSVVTRTVPHTASETDLIKEFDGISSKLDCRPKKLKVFINPSCGKNKGKQIYEKEVAPVFDLAGIDSDVIVTKRGGEAKETLMSCSLEGLDGVISLGGDGSYWEVVSGLLERTQADAGVNLNQVDFIIRISAVPKLHVVSYQRAACHIHMHVHLHTPPSPPSTGTFRVRH